MKPALRPRGFTLIELLVVIAIIGILVAIAMPVLGNFRGDNLAGGVRQMMGDVARARQLAISQRTTVYMVFVPTNFWNSLQFTRLSPVEQAKGRNLYDKQLGAYAFVMLRGAGAQPGQKEPRYLSNWKTLPQGVIIPEFKFRPRQLLPFRITDPTPGVVRSFDVRGFDETRTIPFPSDQAYYDPGNPNKTFPSVPYIAFNHLGQLASQQDEYIPLARGSIAYASDPNKIPLAQAPSLRENPTGNSTNAFTLVHIDWLTGRASVERQEIQ